MEETNTYLLNSDEALQPILQMAQESATSNISTIRTVVLKALSDPKVFCGFDELKQVLQGTLANNNNSSNEGETILRTLDLFSYGTYSDYTKADKGQYLPLSDSQVFKLRQLTVLTMVQKACSCNNNKECVVPYQALAVELGFSTDTDTKDAPATMLRQVEEVVLACVYGRVLAGQLCQKSAALFVTARNGPPCRPRDVPLAQGAEMLEILQHFHQTKLVLARSAQDQIQQAVQLQLDGNRNYQKGVLDRIKKAETNSVGSATHPAFIGGAVRGWPDQGEGERRLSDTMGGSGNRSATSSRRQTKRSRGGIGGAMDSFSRY